MDNFIYYLIIQLFQLDKANCAHPIYKERSKYNVYLNYLMLFTINPYKIKYNNKTFNEKIT